MGTGCASATTLPPTAPRPCGALPGPQASRAAVPAGAAARASQRPAHSRAAATARQPEPPPAPAVRPPALAAPAARQPILTAALRIHSKPRGIRCARKLRLKRKKERWADLKYKKRNLGTWLKANPFAGSSHAKGIVLEKMCVSPLILHFLSKRRAFAAGAGRLGVRRPAQWRRRRGLPDTSGLPVLRGRLFASGTAVRGRAVLCRCAAVLGGSVRCVG